MGAISNVRHPEWTPSQMDAIPNGRNPEWTRIPNGRNPEWTRSRMRTYNHIVTLMLAIAW